MIIYQLLRPFGYLSIKHPSKKIVDWLFPAILTVLIVSAFAFFRGKMDIWGGGGFVISLQALIQSLPGFYIAALAAITSFGGNQSVLDSDIPEPTPTIQTRYGSGYMKIKLTRRRFLSLLFAYLTAISLAISVIVNIVRFFINPIKEMLPQLFIEIGFYVISFIYFLFLFQMLLVTMWGLYYLSDKIHQPDARSMADE